MHRFLLLAAFILFIGCTGNNTSSIDEANKLWVIQLDSVMKNQKNNEIKKLTLEGYKKYKEITSKQELDKAFKDIFADTSRITIQNFSNLDFEIYTIKEVRKSKEDVLRARFNFEDLKKNIYTNLGLYPIDKKELEEELDLIKLEWAYNGNIFYSTAIAHKKAGIIFDTVGYMLITEVVNKKDNSVEDKLVSKTSENDSTSTSLKKGSYVTTKKSSVEKIAKSFWGNVVCSYNFVFQSTFNDEGILIDRKFSSQEYNDLGFMSISKNGYKNTDGLNTSKFNIFEWSWYCFSGNNPTLIDNIAYFDFGTETHTAKLSNINY